MYNFQGSIGRLAGEVSRNIGKVLVQAFNNNGYDITAREWVVLAYITNNKGINQNALCKVINMDKVAVKRVVDILEKKKLVSRKVNQADRRHYQLELTTKGESTYVVLAEMAKLVIEQSTNGVSGEEMTNCLTVLNRINGNMK
ncbi:MarR family transcriptional regulator [Marinilabiliaceae bacterium JC017]|nr:MarR family transcriptional regulator [Marinilabiliaceae bacterium JC017]